MTYAGLGLLNAVCVLGGIGLGLLADRAAGTLPVLMLTGMAVGIVVGVLATRAELKRYS